MGIICKSIIRRRRDYRRDRKKISNRNKKDIKKGKGREDEERYRKENDEGGKCKENSRKDNGWWESLEERWNEDIDGINIIIKNRGRRGRYRRIRVIRKEKVDKNG